MRAHCKMIDCTNTAVADVKLKELLTAKERNLYQGNPDCLGLSGD